MKKIVCLYCCFIFGYFSSCSLVDVSPSKYNPYIDKFLQHGYKNTLPTSKKRNISHESNITKKTKQIDQTKQNFKDLDLYDKYCDNPALFLKDLEDEKDINYLNSMIYTLKRYNFFCSNWTLENILNCEKKLYTLNIKDVKLNMEWYLCSF